LANYDLDAAYVIKLPAHAIGQVAVNSPRRYGVDTSKIIRGGDRVGIYFNEKGASQRGSVSMIGVTPPFRRPPPLTSYYEGRNAGAWSRSAKIGNLPATKKLECPNRSVVTDYNACQIKVWYFFTDYDKI